MVAYFPLVKGYSQLISGGLFILLMLVRIFFLILHYTMHTHLVHHGSFAGPVIVSLFQIGKMGCILAWASNTFLSIAANYVEEGVKAAINQFRYMCCLKKFQQQLDQEEHALDVVQQEVHRLVEEDRRSTKVPDEPVEDWIKRTNQAIEDAHLLQNAIKQDNKCFNSWCPNWAWRWSRSKEAEDLTGTLKNLKEERSTFLKLTHDVDLPNIEFIQSKGLILSKASEAALCEILKALENDGVHMIGLHGMPGVGKTTLAIQVKEEAERRKLFDEFVKVTVTEKPNMSAIQDRIAQQLHLDYGNKENSIKERASKLMLRLQDEKKKLIVLDDVWGELNLNEIGIPSAENLGNCKILLTTRRVPVCDAMNCRPKILLDILTEDEAWVLFKTAANLEDDSTALSNVAKRVAKECGRLPVAIVSLAKALRGKSLHGWERALTKLQEGEHLEIRDLSREENAYKSLKFSFDELPREETKRCLLLCSLYPEDHEICIEDLSRYAFGLRLYQRARSLKDNLSEVVDALDELRDCHLLLEAGKEGHVKMHDLVRDVVLLIGKSYSVAGESKTEKEFIVGGGVGFEEWPTDESFRECAAISLLDNEIDRLPDQLDSPKLEILLLARRAYSTEGYSSSRDKFTNISDKSFHGMEILRVLSLTRVILSIRSLECLTSLRTLELRYCKVSDLDSLQNLKTLEILSLFGSYVVDIPEEIGELKNLKLLELTDCYPGKIPSNLIQNLFKLEELYLGSYEEWEETDNASLMELNSLRHLTTLSLTPRAITGVPENFALPKNLTEYHIHNCDCEYPSFPSRLRYPASRTLCLIPTEQTVRACKELFKNVYDLRMDYNPGRFKNMTPDMSEMGFQDLSRLEIHGYELECLVSTTKQKNIAAKTFSNLVELNIDAVASLNELCDGSPPEGFLEKLQKLTVKECEKIITIFPTKLLQGMLKLESVIIEECESLQDVFQLDGMDDAEECLSHLTTLELICMDALLCIWKGPTHHVNLRSLTRITLWDCGSLKSVISPSLAQTLVHLEKLDIESCGQLEHIISEKDEDGKETFSKTRPQQTCLQNLKEVHVKDCEKLECVFPLSIARGLLQLEVLKVSDCAQLMQVFSDEDGNIFPYPTELELEDSSKVGYLFSSTSAVVLPYLSHVKIHKCPKLLLHSVVQISPKVCSLLCSKF